MGKNDVVEKAERLIKAIYTNLELGEFKNDKELGSTKGNYIVGINIREELMDLETALDKV